MRIMRSRGDGTARRRSRSVERRSISPESSTVRSQSEPIRSNRRRYDSNNIEYNFMEGRRKGSKLLHTVGEEHLYIAKVKTKEEKQFDCYHSKDLGCKAKVFLTDAGICYRKISTRAGELHNHASNPSEIAEMQLVTNIKQRCSSAATVTQNYGAHGNASSRRIYQSTLLQHNERFH